MQKVKTHTFFKKTTCCLVFLFSFLFSFSAHYDKHVRINVSDETTIDSDQISYTEFSLSSIGHLNELPENPSEGESNSGIENEKENEKENEDETDDDKDEIFGHYFLHNILIDFYSLNEKSIGNSDIINQGTVVPFYILFHSWKSFLA